MNRAPNPPRSGAATSQCFTAAAHADGCGEGHIIGSPDTTFGSPPFYASQLVYGSFLEKAIQADATPLPPPLANLSAFAAQSPDGTRAVLRLVNDNTRAIEATIVAHSSSGLNNYSDFVSVQTLTSPINASSPLFAAARGGWNSPQNPTFISPHHSTWRMSDRVFLIPAKSLVVLHFSTHSSASVGEHID